MIELSEGQPFDLDEHELWSSLAQQRGTIIEVNLSSTNLLVSEEVWAAFFIRDVENMLDGSIYLEVAFMGAENEAATSGVENHMGGRLGHLHLCCSKPCLELPEESWGPSVIHVTFLKFWSVGNFNADCVTDAVYADLKKWVAAVKRKDTLASKSGRKLACEQASLHVLALCRAQEKVEARRRRTRRKRRPPRSRKEGRRDARGHVRAEGKAEGAADRGKEETSRSWRGPQSW